MTKLIHQQKFVTKLLFLSFIDKIKTVFRNMIGIVLEVQKSNNMSMAFLKNYTAKLELSFKILWFIYLHFIPKYDILKNNKPG